MGVLGRLLGWCRYPKTKLQRLRLLVESSRREDVVLPLLFDIGILFSTLGWFLAFPISFLLRIPVWILSSDDLSGILWVGILLYQNSQTIYTYRHHTSISRRFVKATKLILFVVDAMAAIGVVGWVFRLLRGSSIPFLVSVGLMVWSVVLGRRFPIEEKERAQFLEGLLGKSFLVRMGRKMKERYDKSIFGRVGRKMKTALGEPHYH